MNEGEAKSQPVVGPPKVELDWTTGCEVYRNSKSGILHLKPRSHKVNAFVCGRAITSDMSLNRQSEGSSQRCKQCAIGRPMRDIDSMNSFMDELKAKRAKSSTGN